MDPSRSDEELFSIADSMYADFVAERLVKDRVHHFRNYPKCFIGEQAVQWMMRPGRVASVQCIADALVLGRELMEIGTFHHVVYEHTFKNAFLYYRFTSDDKVPGTVRKNLPPSDSLSLPPTPRLGKHAEVDAASKADGDQPFQSLKLKEYTAKHRVVFAGHLQALQHRVATLATDFAFTRSITEIFAEEAQEMRCQLENAHSGLADLCGQLLAIRSQLRALLVLTAALSAAVVVLGSAVGICLMMLFAGRQPAKVNGVLWCAIGVFCFSLIIVMVPAVIWLPQHLSGLSLVSSLHPISMTADSAAAGCPTASTHFTVGHGHSNNSTASAASYCGSLASQSETSRFSSEFHSTMDRARANLNPSSLHGSSAASAKQSNLADHSKLTGVLSQSRPAGSGLPPLAPVGLPCHTAPSYLDRSSHSSSTTALSDATSVADQDTVCGSPKGSLQAATSSLCNRAGRLPMTVKGACASPATMPDTPPTPRTSFVIPSEPAALPSPSPNPTHIQQPPLPTHLTHTQPVHTEAIQEISQTTPQLTPKSVVAPKPHSNSSAPCPSNNNTSNTAAAARPSPHSVSSTSQPRRNAKTPLPRPPVGRCFPGPIPSLQALRSSECSPLLFLPNTHASPDLKLLSPCPSPPAQAGSAGSSSRSQIAIADSPSLPINGSEPICFENDLFKGSISLYIAGMDSSPCVLFEGKKRRSWVAVQGRFKSPVAVNSVTTGQEFARPFQKLPAPWFVDKVLLQLARKISPSMRMGDLSAPHMLIPMLAAAQIVNVCQEGEEVAALDVVEDLRLWDPTLSSNGSETGSPLGATVRQRRFMNAKNCEGKTFDTTLVWTFHFWQQHVDMASYSLRFGYMYDLSKHLDGQPLLIMAKDELSGKYLYNFAVWHERLFPAQQQASRQRDIAGASDSSVNRQAACKIPDMSRTGTSKAGGVLSGEIHSGTTLVPPELTQLQPAMTVRARASSVSSGTSADSNSKTQQVFPPRAGFSRNSENAGARAVASGPLEGGVMGLNSLGLSSHQVTARREWGQPRLAQPGRQGAQAVMSDEEDGSSTDTLADV